MVIATVYMARQAIVIHIALKIKMKYAVVRGLILFIEPTALKIVNNHILFVSQGF